MDNELEGVDRGLTEILFWYLPGEVDENHEKVLRCPYTYESGSARFPMSQTRLCVGRHEPGSAKSGLARQGLRWGSARYWLVRVWVVPSQARHHVGFHV
jgi:hypothetical protein